MASVEQTNKPLETAVKGIGLYCLGKSFILRIALPRLLRDSIITIAPVIIIRSSDTQMRRRFAANHR